MKSDKRNHLLRQLALADLITLTASSLAILSLWFYIDGKEYLAISTIFVSMFFDYLDGLVARKYGGSVYGKVLDSLYDVIGFVIFPVIVFMSVANGVWWSIILSILYSLSALTRLSRFTNEGYEVTVKRFYIGMPVLYSKYLLLLIFIPVIGVYLAAFLLTLMVPLMVSNKLFAKPFQIFAILNLLYSLIFLIVYFNS